MDKSLFEAKYNALSDRIRENFDTCRNSPEDAERIHSDELHEVCLFAARFPEQTAARDAYRTASDLIGERGDGENLPEIEFDSSEDGSAAKLGASITEVVNYVDNHGYRLLKDPNDLSMDDLVAMQAFFEPTREGAEVPCPEILQRIETSQEERSSEDEVETDPKADAPAGDGDGTDAELQVSEDGASTEEADPEEKPEATA